MNPLELSHVQQRAFDSFKKAYEKCLKSQIKFFNNYGALMAVDGTKVDRYDDKKGDICDDAPNSINIPGEWSDDKHWFHLTKYGKKIQNQ